jgi:hypothetical protein
MKLTITDNSTLKEVRTRTHRSKTQHSAPIKHFKGKIDGLRVIVTETITGKKFYFVIPHAAYQHMRSTTSIEILFELDGSPSKQRPSNSYNAIPNWWIYQVPSECHMYAYRIDNRSKIPVNSTFNNQYKED